jgi:hypothetical protein
MYFSFRKFGQDRVRRKLRLFDFTDVDIKTQGKSGRHPPAGREPDR